MSSNAENTAEGDAAASIPFGPMTEAETKAAALELITYINWLARAKDRAVDSTLNSTDGYASKALEVRDASLLVTLGIQSPGQANTAVPSTATPPTSIERFRESFRLLHWGTSQTNWASEAFDYFWDSNEGVMGMVTWRLLEGLKNAAVDEVRAIEWEQRFPGIGRRGLEQVKAELELEEAEKGRMG